MAQENIPKDFQFLFKFVNLPFKPGIPSVFRPQKKLKRTPTKQPERLKLLTKGEITKIKRDYKKKYGDELTDSDIKYGVITKDKKCVEYSWSPNINGEPEFDGANKCYPSPDEFKGVFEKEKIVNVTGYYTLIGILETCYEILKAQISLNDDVEDVDVSSTLWTILEKWNELSGENLKPHILRNLRTYWHDKTFPLRIYAEILNFVNSNHAALLRQCPCCGSFWITKKASSRHIFCSKECNKVFHQQTREENAESVSASKKIKRNREKKNDYNAIKEFYLKVGYGNEQAEKHASKWIYNEGKTLKNFEKHELGKG